MPSNMPLRKHPKPHIKDYYLDCRARGVGSTDLFECMMGVFKCHNLKLFGGVNYCKHPDVKSFAISNQP